MSSLNTSRTPVQVWLLPFFSAEIALSDAVKTLREADAVKACAAGLRKKCENYDFELDLIYCHAAGFQTSMNMHRKSRPSSFENVFNVLFPYKRKSGNIKRTSDFMFQMVFYLV